METIEGYRFRIDLDDRGMSNGLSVLAKKATTLKKIMRSNFVESENMGNGFMALKNKVSDISNAMEAYRQAITESQKELQNFNERQNAGNKLTEDESKKMLNLTNKQANYRNQLAKLNAQLAEVKRQRDLYNEGLVRTRSVMSGMTASMSAYDHLLEQQGLKAYATKGKVNSLLETQKLSARQYSQEVAQTKSLQSSLAKLQKEYSDNEATVKKLSGLRAQTKAALDREKNSANSNAAAIDKLSRKYGHLSEHYNKYKSGQGVLRNSINNTTSDLQKQTVATTRASAQMLKFKAAINSVGTGRFGALSRSIRNVDARLRASTAHTRQWANSLRGGLMTAGLAVGAFGAGIGKAVSMSANLQQSWVTTKNLLVTGGDSVKETTRNVANMQRDATRYSKEYGMSQKDIADQYVELTKRGYSASASLGSMKSMLQASRASGDDFKDVVQNVSSTVDAFGMRAKAQETERKKGVKAATEEMTRDTKRVTNAMAYAADMTATGFKGMGEAMSYVSASAHQAGFSVEETAAAIGELSNAGIEGTRAGTGLRKTINSLLAPTKGAQDALKKYHMSINDFKNADGSLKPLSQIMKIINKHTKDLGKADKGAFFKAVFGTTGQQAAMVLAQNANAMEKLVKQEKEAEKNNYVQRLAQKNMASTKMQMKQLQMLAQAFAIQIGTSLLPAVNKVGKAISQWAESSKGKATLKQFSDGVKAAGNSVARHAGSIISFLGGFASGLFYVAKGVHTLLTPLRWLTGAIAKVTGHSGDVSRFFGIVTGGVVGIVAVLKVLHTAIQGVNAVRSDLKSVGVMKDTTTQLKEQDSLYARMIELQEQSLALSKRQADAQGINTENLGKNTASQEAENVVNELPTGKGKTAAKVTAEVEPELNEAKASGIKGWFQKTLPTFAKTSGETSASKMSASFLSKLNLFKGGFLSAGLKIGGKIFDGIALIFAAKDIAGNIFKGVTSSSRKTRYQKAGKAVGGVIGGGIAAYFTAGSPTATAIGAQIGSAATGWAYKAVDNFKKGWNGYLKGYKPKGIIATVGFDLKSATVKYNNWVASIERKHPNLAIAIRIHRATLNTSLGVVKGFFRTLHTEVKMLWDTIADISTLRFNRIGKDLSRNGKDWLKGIKSDWKGFTDWWTKNTKKLSIKKPKKSTKRKSSTPRTFKSSKNVKYSKSDVANLKDMTKAVGAYKKALQGLKQTVRSNDPSKEMNTMLKHLKGSVKGWSSLAKPIKKIGDAFKTLSKFTSSMAKYDAFAAMNKDLPKLDKTLKNSKVGPRIKKIGEQIRSSHVDKALKTLTKEIKRDNSAWKDFAKRVKTVGNGMKEFAKAIDSMAGKKGSLQNFISLMPKLSDALGSKYKIGSKMKTMANDIKKSGLKDALNKITKELKNDVSKWKAFAAPVKTIGGYMKDFQKATSALSSGKSGVSALNTQLVDLTNTIKKNDIAGKIKDMAKDIKGAKLDKVLSGLTTSVKKNKGSWKDIGKYMGTMATSLKKFNSQTKAYGGKKDPLSGMVKGFSALQAYLKKSDIGKRLESIAKDIKHSKINSSLKTLNTVVGKSAKTWKSMTKPMNTVSKAFKTLGTNVSKLTGKKNGFTQLGKDVKTFYQTVRKYPFGKQIASQARIANNAMAGKKSGFVRQFVRETNQMTRAVRNFGRAFSRDWKGSWKNLNAPVSRALRSVDSTVRSRLNAVQSRREEFCSAFLRGWENWIDRVKSDFRSGFNKLPGYAGSAMREIVSRLNKGITGVNKVIGDFGGDKKLSAISYANGTQGGHPGGHMLVNDSSRPHWKELVKFPGKAWQMFKGRNVLIPNAPKGTQVINGEQTYALNSRGLLPQLGIRAYANGSLSDEEQEQISEEFEKNPAAASKKLILKVTDWSSNIPVVASLGQAMAVGFSKGIANVLKDLLGEVKEPVNGDWSPVIRSAAAKMGEHVSAYDIKRILNTINHESRGNEHITQPGKDPDGDGSGPARGLLQFKTMTFNHYKVSGHGNIYSGFDQLMALFNDTNWRGDLRWNGGWSPSGGRRRANGGLMVSDQLYHIAENNKPEMIIPLDINKRPRALNLIDTTLNHMENDGGGTGGLHSRASHSNEETNGYLKQAVVILGQIAGLSAQQIDALANINIGTDLKSRRARSRFYNDYGSDQRITDYQSF